MTGPSPSLAYRLSSPAAAPLSPAAAPSPAAVSRRRLTTTPGPLRGLAPIYTESSPTPPAATAEAAALPIIMYDASVGVPLRREQGKRGAHEGRAGQLYRPTSRDGAVGYTPGQAVEMILLLRRRANYRALVSLPQQRNTSHLIPPHTEAVTRAATTTLVSAEMMEPTCMHRGTRTQIPDNLWGPGRSALSPCLPPHRGGISRSKL
jgi:hypothetical protein